MLGFACTPSPATNTSTNQPSVVEDTTVSCHATAECPGAEPVRCEGERRAGRCSAFDGVGCGFAPQTGLGPDDKPIYGPLEVQCCDGTESCAEKLAG